MISSAAIPENTKPRSRWIWGWFCYVFLSAGIAGLVIVGRLSSYFDGLALGQSDTLFSMAITGMLVLSLLLLLPLGLFALYRIIRGRDHWLKLAILPFPLLALVGPRYIPLPTFNQGVIETLRAKTTAADFVKAVKTTAAAPPKWLAARKDLTTEQDHWPEQQKWLAATAPFDRISLQPQPKIYLESQTLLIEWGGPLSRRWGLALSAKTGVKPEIPSHAAHSEEIYPEVWLFNIYL